MVFFSWGRCGHALAVHGSVCIRAGNFLALQMLDMALPVGPVLEWAYKTALVLIAKCS